MKIDSTNSLHRESKTGTCLCILCTYSRLTVVGGEVGG